MIKIVHGGQHGRALCLGLGKLTFAFLSVSNWI